MGWDFSRSFFIILLMNSLWVVCDFVISPTDCRTFSGFSRIFKVILLYLMLGYAENKHCKPASAVLCCFQVSCRRNRIFPVSIAFDRIAEARRHHFSQKDQKGNRRNMWVFSFTVVVVWRKKVAKWGQLVFSGNYRPISSSQRFPFVVFEVASVRCLGF